jgi:hypothetical protein
MSVRHEVNFELSSYFLNHRPLELDNYVLNDRLKIGSSKPTPWSMIGRKIPIQPVKHLANGYFESTFHYSALAVTAPIRKSYFGYFQSPKYFSEFSTQIREIFKLKSTSKSLSMLMEEIDFQETIAIHLRRGDYLGKEYFHGLATEVYFRKAIKLINSKQSPKKIVVFSEDYLVAKEMFPDAWQIITPAILSSPGENIALISKFEHFIGSNSSFSWWGAFLSEKRDGFTIFPRPWFSDAGFNDRDLLMPQWITLGNGGADVID